MKMNAMIALAVMLAAPVAEAQIYKCVENGRQVFSEHPCGGDAKAIEVKPASGPAPRGAGGLSSDAGSAQAQAASGDLARRADLAAKKRILDDDIYNKESRIRSLRREMDERLAALKYKKAYANNNLAGAVWEQSISDEMMAVATSYDNKIRSVERELADLKGQRYALDK